MLAKKNATVLQLAEALGKSQEELLKLNIRAETNLERIQRVLKIWRESLNEGMIPSDNRNLLDFALGLAKKAEKSLGDLLIQYLWDTHPATFRHSIAYHLCELLREGITNFSGRDEVRIKKLDWKDVSRKLPLKVNWEDNLQDKPDDEWYDIDFRLEIPNIGADLQIAQSDYWDLAVTFQVSPEMKLDSPYKDIIQLVLEGFLADLVRANGEDWKGKTPIDPADTGTRASLLNKDLDFFAAATIRRAKEKYTLLTGKKIDALELMFYRPGTSGDGFLFYPCWTSDLVTPNPARKKTIKTGAGSISGNNANAFSDIDGASELAGRALTHTAHWHDQGSPNTGEEWDTLVNYHCLDQVLSSITVALSKFQFGNEPIEDIFPIITQILLTYPPNFLTTSLLKNNGGGFPLCYQPKGKGVAGKVAETLVTQLIPRVGKEPRLKYSSRDLHYLLMGVFEKPYGQITNSSCIVAPLLCKGQFMGVLVAYRKGTISGKRYTPGFQLPDAGVLESIAGKVAEEIRQKKEFDFLQDLYRSWDPFRSWGDPLRGAEVVYDDFITSFKERIGFVLNIRAVSICITKLPGGDSTELVAWPDCKTNDNFFADLFTEQPEQRQVQFLKWRERGTSRRPDYINNAPPITVVLFIPSFREADPKAPVYLLKLELDDEPEVFESHRHEIEAFFTSCIAATGAISTRHEIRIKRAYERDAKEIELYRRMCDAGPSVTDRLPFDWNNASNHLLEVISFVEENDSDLHRTIVTHTAYPKEVYLKLHKLIVQWRSIGGGRR